MANKASGFGRVITLLSITSMAAAPAVANVARERELLQSRVDAVRQALHSGQGITAPPVATLTAQAANWNNWPKWSKWSNWANQ